MKKKMNTPSILFGVALMITSILSACSNKQKHQQTAQARVGLFYTCVMHPQIHEARSGNCPICGMVLVPENSQTGKRAGISLDAVLKSTSSVVISNIKAIRPVERRFPLVAAGQGYLDYDTRTFNNIAARVSGRIERLYIRYAFQSIHKGQRIYDIYSPELVTAQQDFIFLARNAETDKNLMNSAKQKLLLLGLTREQIDRIVKTGKLFYQLPVFSPYEGHVHDRQHSQMPGSNKTEETFGLAVNLPLSLKEGMNVEKGQTLFNVVNSHKVWAIIKISQSEAVALKLNQRVQIVSADSSFGPITGKVDFIEPSLETGDKSTSIRVYLSNMNHRLKINALINARIFTGERKGLWIPRSALVYLGQEQIAWLKQGNTYKAKRVVTGMRINDLVQVLGGLLPTDSVAVSAQYLGDSDSFIKTQGDD